MFHRFFRLLPALLGVWLLAACSSSTQENSPADQPSAAPPAMLQIAAAADLRYAMDSLVALFREQQPGFTVKVTFGSSGKFYEQITQGAPFDLFFSADSNYPRQLQKQGLTAAAPVLYARGQLVLWSRTLDPAAQGIRTLLDPQVKRIAIANPAHAPYGRKAEEVLRHYQLYDQVKPRLVLGENIAQTANYAASGAADVGLIALALALSPELKAQGRYYPIPQDAYTPLEQSFVVLKGQERQSATKFVEFMASPSAQAVLRAYGFSLPQ